MEDKKASVMAPYATACRVVESPWGVGVLVPCRSVWDSGATPIPFSSGKVMNLIPHIPEDLAFGREELRAGAKKAYTKR
jgi:hypothetical protein